jgi:hypothetical protein
MKTYFDNLVNSSNLNHLSKNGKQDFWIVGSGSIVKSQLMQMGMEISTVDNYTTPGCYFLDVNGDPVWWSGAHGFKHGPKKHILSEVTDEIVEMVQQRKLRIVIAADKEGGGMVSSTFNAFESTTAVMLARGFPPNSVLIIQGNKKIEQQYNRWLAFSNSPKMFDVMYSNHFGRIFFGWMQKAMPTVPLIAEAINNTTAFDYNSLNRVYRPHRSAHLYTLIENNILDKGLVSANDKRYSGLDNEAADLAKPDWRAYNYDVYGDTMVKHFPKFVDGNWEIENAANSYNTEIYKNSLMSFITETKYNEDVVFLTEKVFKPIALGHPMILLASAGTLRGLRELGFKTDWCGINPNYNNIVDDKSRFDATTQVLVDWVNLPKEEKIRRIIESLPTIHHNFNLIRQRDFYKEALAEVFKRTRIYFS